MLEMQRIAKGIKDSLGEGVVLCPGCKLIVSVDPDCYSCGSYGPSESVGIDEEGNTTSFCYHCMCKKGECL
jgi:hypothetical protein